ncbi:MAG: hypothetical protein LC733_11290 [Actinobacteria bacterium]|nr:hypothetical protein [Actinomycetota bacterium]
MLTGLLIGIAQSPAAADVTSVRGYACGFITNVGLFGGPQSRMGCNPQISRHGSAPVGPTTLSPSVALPSTGSPEISAHDADGIRHVFGPATITGGRWTADLGTAPPSGPITVRTAGTIGAGGTVTASTDVTLDAGVPGSETPNDGPGGFGPFPVEGDSLHVECRATETSLTGSTTFVNATVATSTDAQGEPVTFEAIPNNPPVNYTRHGVITNVGDVFAVVYNEHIINPDGSLTVNAAHMYLFGPTAVGEVIKGQVTCGTNPPASPPSDTKIPVCGTPVVKPVGPSDPTPQTPRSELVGVFDAGGLQSITNVQVTNGTVQIGTFPNNDADPNNDYLKFTPGQTGPLAVIGTRTATAETAGLPLVWSFDATDAAGNVAHCTGVLASGATTSVVQSSAEPGDPISASGSGLTPSVSYRLRMGTSSANCAASPLALGGNVVSSASGTIGATSRIIPTNATSGVKFLCWVRVGSTTDAGAADSITVV